MAQHRRDLFTEHYRTSAAYHSQCAVRLQAGNRHRAMRHLQAARAAQRCEADNARARREWANDTRGY